MEWPVWTMAPLTGEDLLDPFQVFTLFLCHPSQNYCSLIQNCDHMEMQSRRSKKCWCNATCKARTPTGGEILNNIFHIKCGTIFRRKRKRKIRGNNKYILGRQRVQGFLQIWQKRRFSFFWRVLENCPKVHIWLRNYSLLFKYQVTDSRQVTNSE